MCMSMLALLALSDSCRGVNTYKARLCTILLKILWQSCHYDYGIPAAQRIPGVRTVDRLIVPT